MKKIKNNLLHVILFLVMIQGSASLKAQVRIGGSVNPNPNAILDLNANDTAIGSKGLLLPRVALVSTTSASPLAEHITGMYVYNTATANDVMPGVYYNDGTRWIRSGSGVETLNVRQLEIPIGETISTQSIIYQGETTSVSSGLMVLNIKPIFSDEMMALTSFTITSSAKKNEAGTAIKWFMRIASSNIDSTKSSELEKLIITYVCNDVVSSSSLLETYILVGQ